LGVFCLYLYVISFDFNSGVGILVTEVGELADTDSSIANWSTPYMGVGGVWGGFRPPQNPKYPTQTLPRLGASAKF